ncbi:MAG: adenylyltransferase/cytidyltransferase family protein [Candidatus Uhrbacteria bacterium]|nr:adenylyltransferase/cytidyltransferase family protein [Candidatus Uhrbacteria bacterium]
MDKRVLVFGTFDGIHSGHEFFLRSSKSRGTELVVGVARDAHVQQLKTRKPLKHEERRLKEIRALPYVDSARLCDEHVSSFKIVEDVSPDLIVLGHDQNELESALLSWMGESGHYIPMMRLKKV